MAKDRLELRIAQLDAEIEEKQRMRAWLVEAAEPADKTEKPKRGRKPGKKGLPANGNVATETGF